MPRRDRGAGHNLLHQYFYGRHSWRGRALVVLLCLGLGVHLLSQSSLMSSKRGEWSSASKTAETLVIYVFSNTDVEYANNLRFFLQFGVAADDGCDYIVIIQTGEGLEVSVRV